MRPLPRPIKRRFSGVRLHLQDVEEIAAAVSEIAQEPLKYVADNFEFDSLSGLRHYTEEPWRLAIDSKEPRLHVSIHHVFGAVISGSVTGPEVATAVERICAILNRCRSRVRAAVASLKTGVFFLVLGIVLMVLFARARGYGKLALGVGLIGALGVAWLCVWASEGNTRVFLRKVSDKRSFFRTNKDTLIRDALIAILSAGLTVLVTLLVRE